MSEPLIDNTFVVSIPKAALGHLIVIDVSDKGEINLEIFPTEGQETTLDVDDVARTLTSVGVAYKNAEAFGFTDSEEDTE